MFLRRKTIEQLSDEGLVANVKSGQQASLAALWDRYAHLLFGVGMKYLKETEQAKDEVIGLFAALPDLLVRHEVKTFRPWVHAVMRNRCLMLLRKRHPETRLDDQHDPTRENEDDDNLLREATLQHLEAALLDLNEGQRTCIRLFYLEGNSYQDTAERSGFSPEQVRSHIQNGKRNLRLLLSRARPIGTQAHADQNLT